MSNGVVYVGSSNGDVYALNAGTGAKLWTYATGGSVISSPAVANGMVYVGSYGNNLYALDARTGSAFGPITPNCFPLQPWQTRWFMCLLRRQYLCAGCQNGRQTVGL